jgi:hypothetical protein
VTRSFKIYQGEDETPEYDLTDPDSNVHVIWDEIEAGGRAFRGESTTSSIPIRDEQAVTGNSADLPMGLTNVSLSRGSKWEWLENVGDANETRMAAGRIGTKDYSRGRQKADRAREVVMQGGDRNEELQDIIIDDWVRPEESDVTRVLALLTAYLTGSPRATTTIASTYVASGNTVTMAAKTYDGTNPKAVLDEIASYANKEYFVTIDDELWYDTGDSLTYPAGIRISDRLDELDTSGVCTDAELTLALDTSAQEDDGVGTLAVEVDGQPNRVLYVAVMIGEAPTVNWHPDYINSGTPGTGVPFTLVDSVTIVDARTIRLYRLIAPANSSVSTSVVRIAASAGVRWIAGAWLVTGADQTAPETDVGTNSGTGATSSVSVSGVAGDLIIDVAAWAETNATVTFPVEAGDQTQDFSRTIDRSFGLPDYAMGGSHGADTTPAWSFTNSHPWAALAWAVAPATSAGGEGEGLPTFPPKWDVGPSSTEDGLELVSGLRLYYGQDGAYVYVTDATTVAEYWHAERSFYTSDPAISDATKATVLAEAILQRLKTEGRSYNVSIGPLNEDQVGCIKPGQLLYIKARAIPDADDQFQPRRIAQLKWTTPVPGVFWARMQLNRPRKSAPYGVGPKSSHDAIAAHKEGDSHPASAITIIDAGAYFTGNDVEAALQELGASVGGGPHTHDADDVIIADAGGYYTGTEVEAALQEIGADLAAGVGVTDHGALTGLADDDHPQYVLKTLGGKEVVNVVAASGASETLSLVDGNWHDVTLTADCTLTLTGATNGVGCSMLLILRQDGTGGWEVTWPASVEWPDGMAPVLSTDPNGVDIVTLVSNDGGATWYGGFPGAASQITADDVRDVGGHWEVLMADGVTPPEPLTNEAEDDWLYGWVSDA